MAEFGADVIKIDNPARGRTVARHNDINRGKRSILLDLKSEEGRDVFWRLLEDADVVAQNYRAGKLEKLGLDYESVRARKPDIVYASLNAFGHLGPWAMRPGHEQFRPGRHGHGPALWRGRGADDAAQRGERLRHRVHGRLRHGASPCCTGGAPGRGSTWTRPWLIPP